MQTGDRDFAVKTALHSPERLLHHEHLPDIRTGEDEHAGDRSHGECHQETSGNLQHRPHAEPLSDRHPRTPVRC